MTAVRSFSFVFLALVSVLTTSCSKEDDPAPVVGSLRLLPNNYGSVRNTTYFLFTEAGWTGARATSPLRQDVFPSGPTEVAISELNPGNYVLVVNSTNAITVQVTAGRTNDVHF